MKRIRDKLSRFVGASVVMTTVLLVVTAPSTAIAGRPGQLTPPYSGTTEAFGGCRFYDTTFGEVCHAFPYADLSTGHIGGFTRVQSGEFGRRPLVQSNTAMVDSSLIISASLRKAATTLPVTVNLRIDEGRADLEGTKGVDQSPERAKVLLQLILYDAGGGVTISGYRLLDDDPTTPAPTTLSGPMTLSLDATNVPRGDYRIQIRSVLIAEMSSGDTGTTRAILNAYITSIELG